MARCCQVIGALVRDMVGPMAQKLHLIKIVIGPLLDYMENLREILGSHMVPGVLHLQLVMDFRMTRFSGLTGSAHLQRSTVGQP